MAKINENFSNFFAKATAAGFGTNQIVSFMQDIFSNPSAQAEKKRLNKGVSEGTLRPDEEAAAQSIHRAEGPERALKRGAGLAATAGGIGLGVAQLPGLIKKGAGILGGLLNQGKQSQEQQNQTNEQEPKQPGGFQEFIKQNPELGAYLDSLMQKGLDPVKAASEAKKNRKFGPLVQSIEGQMGQSFEDMISQLFQGSQGNGQNTSQSGNATPAMTQFMAALQEFKKLRSGK